MMTTCRSLRGLPIQCLGLEETRVSEEMAMELFTAGRKAFDEQQAVKKNGSEQ